MGLASSSVLCPDASDRNATRPAEAAAGENNAWAAPGPGAGSGSRRRDQEGEGEEGEVWGEEEVGVEERRRVEEAVEAAAGGAEAEEGRRREARQHAVHQRLRQPAPHAGFHVHRLRRVEARQVVRVVHHAAGAALRSSAWEPDRSRSMGLAGN